MIHARQLRKAYRDGADEVRVLNGLDLDVRAGEFVAVVGPSGSGKSTLLHVLGGLDASYAGEVEVAGVRLNELNDVALARFRNRQVGFVFQSFHLIASLSALDNVLLPAFFDVEAVAGPRRKRAEDVLARVGLIEKKNRVPAQLSGGERQRTAIARALFAEPKLLLCDEPTGNLDETTGGEVIELFRELHRDGLTILVVTHEDRMSTAAQRVLRLTGGVLRPSGGEGR
ncbi:MAG TPA: ABC transporter ATP-binding protein [Myxococcaceae bacterium]|nr:ABC transporter ATP-binding protein [Myxococcaceae bacterium]